MASRKAPPSRIPQQAQKTAATNKPAGSAPVAVKPAVKANQAIPGSWMDEHWESWLQPVFYIALAGLVYLLYSVGVLSDLVTGALLIFALVGYVWFAAVYAEAKRFPSEKRPLVYVLSAVMGVLMLVPVVFAIWPGDPIVQGTVEKKGDAIQLDTLPGAAEYMVVAGGALSPTLTVDRNIEYKLENRSGKTKKAVMTGEIQQIHQQTQSRRGLSGQTVKVHSQDKAYLTLDPETPLTVTSDLDAKDLVDGVHVAIYSKPVGVWLLAIASLFYLLLIAYETKAIAEKGRGYLAAGGGLALLGALIFIRTSTPYTPFTTNSDLARSALGAGMLGGILGAIGGLFLAFVIARIIGRPPLPEIAKPAEDED